MSAVDEVPTPNLDRQNEVIRNGSAAAVQDFIDWLADNLQSGESGFDEQLLLRVPSARRVTCRFVEGSERRRAPGVERSLRRGDHCVDGEIFDAENGVTCTWCWRCKSTGAVYTDTDVTDLHSERSRELVMSAYFGINLIGCEDERRALLEAIRGG